MVYDVRRQIPEEFKGGNMIKSLASSSVYEFTKKLVLAIDRVLIDEFNWTDNQLETFWRRVLEELEIDKESIDRIFIEVFGIERMIADAIYTSLEEYVLKEATR